MAKSGMMSGNAQTPPIFANPQSVFRRGEGGILPERGSRGQLDMVKALSQAGMSSAQNSGSPLLALLAPLVGGAVGSRTEGLFKDAQKGRDASAIDQLMAAMGGGSASAAANMTPDARPVRADGYDAMAATGGPTNAAAETLFPQSLIQTESGGKWDALNNVPGAGGVGHGGRLQFGTARLQDAANSGVIPPMTPQEFARQPPGVQKAVEGWHFNDINKRIRTMGLDKYIGQTVGGVEITLPGIQAMAHLGGIGGAQQFLSSNGQYNPADANGTSLADYAKTHGGARDVASRVASGDFSALANAGQSSRMGPDQMRALIGLMTNTEVSDPIRQLASTMVSSAMGAPGSMSPTDQIDLASGMLDLEQALAPPTVEPGFRVASPEEAAQYGAQAGQFGPDGRFYPATGNNTASGDAGAMRQQNEATTIISGAISDLQASGFSREEALGMVARDPIYGPQFQILGVDPADLARAQVIEGAQQAQDSTGFWSRIFGSGNDGAASPTQPPAPAAPDNDPLGLR